MKKDVILQNLIKKEIRRQRETLNLIASENFVSPEILNILSSPLTNKYSEGYPAKRYYAGNQYYDEIENLTRERALRIFKLNPRVWSVNVQPYSGSPANLEIYFALLNFGDTLMGMNLTAGGHLTHGHFANFSGKAYRVIPYGIDPRSGFLDYQKLENLALKHKPKIIVSGASAYPRKINFQKIGRIAKKIGAYHLADISHIAGLVAAGLHPSPFAFSEIVMTTTHKTLRGPRAAIIFSKKSLASAIDKAVFPGIQGGPHNNVIAAIAATFFEAQQPEFKFYQKQVVKNARVLAAALKKLGFNLVTGGTDNHLLLIDLKNLGVDGFRAEKKLEAVGIVTNRNPLVGDKNLFRPSGLRLGTPAVTTAGLKEKEMRQIAEWIYRILVKKESPKFIKKEVGKFCQKFPLKIYGEN
jgi:glycine hydroxymethyltransferase